MSDEDLATLYAQGVSEQKSPNGPQSGRASLSGARVAGVIVQPVQATDLHGTLGVAIGQNLDLAQILYLHSVLCRHGQQSRHLRVRS